MSAIGDEIAAIVAALESVGIPASNHPGDMWAMASAEDVAALVGAPEDVQLVNMTGAVRIRVPITIASRGPDVEGYARLVEVLPDALRALRTGEQAARSRHQRGDASLPAYLIDCLRSVEE